ncbi:MAG: HEAT repeat domain-containing protein, partial [Bacteriovoracaceae bacterium]
MKHLLITLVLLLFSKFVFGNVQRGSLQNLNSPDIKEMLLANYSKTYKTKAGLEKLKRSTLRYSGKAVPALVQVMKESRFPEKNRWIATFLLGKIVGVKSAPFIAKFSNHPNWVMRLASLKTLLALRQTQYTSIYQKAL